MTLFVIILLLTGGGERSHLMQRLPPLQMFLVLEHPNEKERLLLFQKLVLNEREIFLNLVFNLTSTLSSEELDLLNDLVNVRYDDLAGNSPSAAGDFR